VSFGALVSSFLVATFFNNFLPSNIGGDVMRIHDTSKAAGSRTVAATVVFVDRGIGLLGLMFLAAVGATATAQLSPTIAPVCPGLLWLVLAAGIAATAFAVMVPHGVGFALKPFRAIHQEWVGRQIERLTVALGKFRDEPWALVNAFIGSIGV